MDIQMTAHERNAGFSFKSFLPVVGAILVVCLVLFSIFLIITSVTNFRREANYLLNQSQAAPGGLEISDLSVSAPAASDYQPVFGPTQNLIKNYAPTPFFVMVGSMLLLFATFFIFILAFKK